MTNQKFQLKQSDINIPTEWKRIVMEEGEDGKLHPVAVENVAIEDAKIHQTNQPTNPDNLAHPINAKSHNSRLSNVPDEWQDVFFEQAQHANSDAVSTISIQDNPDFSERTIPEMTLAQLFENEPNDPQSDHSDPSYTNHSKQELADSWADNPENPKHPSANSMTTAQPRYHPPLLVPMPSSQDKMPAILQANVLSPDVNSIDTSNELDDEPTDFRSAQYSNSPYLNPPPASMPPAYHSNISPSLPIEFQEQNDIPNFSEADQHDSLDNHAIIFHAQNDLNPHKTFNPETSTNSADQNISSETDSSQLQHRYSPLYQDELLSQWQQIIDGQSEIISQINNFSNSLNQHSHTSSISESLSSLEQKIQSISKVLMPLEQKIQSLSEIHQLQYESFFQQVEQINRSVCSIQDELRSQNSYAVLQDILLLYDFIDLRLNSVPAEHSTNSRSREILAIRSRILELLRRQNLFPIEVTDHHFDPSSQRILQEISTQNPQEDGLISRIFRQGFRLGECVFRPTEVEIKRYQAND